MRRTNPFEPLEPIEPAPPLSYEIKGAARPAGYPFTFHFSERRPPLVQYILF